MVAHARSAKGSLLCADLLERFVGDRALLVPVLLTKARLLALSGEIDTARETLDTAARYVDELDLGLPAIAVTQVRGLVESLAGDHDERPELFRDAAAALHAAGHGGAATTLEIYAARETFRLGDPRPAAQELLRREGPAPAQRRGHRAHPAAAIASRRTTDATGPGRPPPRRLLPRSTDDRHAPGATSSSRSPTSGGPPDVTRPGPSEKRSTPTTATRASLLAHRTRDLLGDP